jgi:O-antigen polymerase
MVKLNTSKITIDQYIIFIKKHSIILTLAVFFTCVILDKNLYNGIVTSKILFFLSLSAIIYIYLSLIYMNSLKKIELTWLDALVCLYIIYVYLGKLRYSTENILDINTLSLVFIIPFYFCIKQSKLNNPKTVDLILFLFIFSGIYQLLYGLLQLYGFLPTQNFRFPITGSFFNPAPYSGFIVSILPLALASYYSKQRSFAVRNLSLIYILGTILVLPSTLSRSAWVAGIVSCFIVFYYQYNLRKVLKCISYKKIILIVFLGTVFFGIFTYSLIKIKEKSAQGRLLVWDLSMDMIKDNFLFGVGHGRFNVEYAKYQVNYFSSALDDKYYLLAGKGEYLFNEYLQIFVEQGIIGILLFGTIIILVFISFFKQERIGIDMRIGTFASLIAILIFAFFSYPFSILPILLNFFFLIALISSSDNVIIALRYKLKPIIALTYIILSSIVLYHTTIIYNSYKEFNNANVNLLMGNYYEAKIIYQSNYNLLKNDGSFLMQYGQTLNHLRQYKKAIKVLRSAKKLISDPFLYTSLGDAYKNIQDYENAERCYSFASNYIPYLFYPKYLLAKLYQGQGKFKEANSMAKLILNMQPKVPSIVIDQIKEEMKYLLQKNNETHLLREQ